MAGRGRKRKNDLYFGPDQEEAVRQYLACDDAIERNAIYNKWLREPFDKMIESIIRRYKLYRKSYTFEELHAETLSHLILKADKFDPEQGKKAYSYYGTVCKHYIIMLLMKDEKGFKQNLSFDESFGTIEQRDDMMYNIDETDYTLTDFIKSVSEEIKKELEKGSIEMQSEDTYPKKKKMTENEFKLGLALVDILDNWESVMVEMEGSVKYNKNAILATIRENTNLTTKDIRNAMGRYTTLYNVFKEDMIDEGYL